MSKKWKVIVEYTTLREIAVLADDAHEARHLATDEADRLYPQEGAWEAIDWKEVDE